MTDESSTLHPPEVYLQRISSEMTQLRQMMSKIVFSIADAESEIPEKMRRFMNYMHDIHDIKFMYEELGHPIPIHLREELERCDDRYRQLLVEAHTDGGPFEKIRREMAKDPANRWDHTRQLNAPKEVPK